MSKKLLNEYLIRKSVGQTNNNQKKYTVGKIVECEAYTGVNDHASQTFNNKQTDRLKSMYM
jgi:3-methyladenine DNA glycosylase Mpg